MTNENASEEAGFSREYVEKLRREAADWRTKYRDLESRQEVEVELSKRGVKADPSWIKVQEGMSVSDAVEDLVARYPHLKADGTVDNNTPYERPRGTPTNPEHKVHPPGSPEPKRTPQPVASNYQSTSPADNPKQGRSLKEIKQDPKARSELRERYRQLISDSSRQVNNF